MALAYRSSRFGGRMSQRMTAGRLVATLACLTAACNRNSVAEANASNPSGDTAQLSPPSQDLDEEVEALIAYQKQYIMSQQVPVATYLAMTKPYAIWDSRALTQQRLLLRGQEIAPKQLPNYLWGRIGPQYGLTAAELRGVADDFLRQCIEAPDGHRANATSNYKDLEQIVRAVRASSRSVLVQQTMLGKFSYERVDELLRQGNAYWRYERDGRSTTFMTPRQVPAADAKFTPADEAVLNSLAKTRCYAAVKINSMVALITGGILDNSCGYIWSEAAPTQDSLGALFHPIRLDPVAPNLYYYVSN